jgi:hypothetical protein
MDVTQRRPTDERPLLVAEHVLDRRALVPNAPRVVDDRHDVGTVLEKRAKRLGGVALDADATTGDDAPAEVGNQLLVDDGDDAAIAAAGVSEAVRDSSLGRHRREGVRDPRPLGRVNVREEVVSAKLPAVDAEHRRHRRPGEHHFAVDGDHRHEPIRVRPRRSRRRRLGPLDARLCRRHQRGMCRKLDIDSVTFRTIRIWAVGVSPIRLRPLGVATRRLVGGRATTGRRGTHGTCRVNDVERLNPCAQDIRTDTGGSLGRVRRVTTGDAGWSQKD